MKIDKSQRLRTERVLRERCDELVLLKLVLRLALCCVVPVQIGIWHGKCTPASASGLVPPLADSLRLFPLWTSTLLQIVIARSSGPEVKSPVSCFYVLPLRQPRPPRTASLKPFVLFLGLRLRATVATILALFNFGLKRRGSIVP